MVGQRGEHARRRKVKGGKTPYRPPDLKERAEHLKYQQDVVFIDVIDFLGEQAENFLSRHVHHYYQKRQPKKAHIFYVLPEVEQLVVAHHPVIDPKKKARWEVFVEKTVSVDQKFLIPFCYSDKIPTIRKEPTYYLQNWERQGLSEDEYEEGLYEDNYEEVYHLNRPRPEYKWCLLEQPVWESCDTGREVMLYLKKSPLKIPESGAKSDLSKTIFSTFVEGMGFMNMVHRDFVGPNLPLDPGNPI